VTRGNGHEIRKKLKGINGQGVNVRKRRGTKWDIRRTKKKIFTAKEMTSLNVLTYKTGSNKQDIHVKQEKIHCGYRLRTVSCYNTTGKF
jgi:hypothetical protein